VTFGKIAGENAAKSTVEFEYKNIENIKEKDTQKIEDILNKEVVKNFYDIKSNLAKMMFKDVGLFRNNDGLIDALEEYTHLNSQYKKTGIKDKSKIYNKTLVEFIELQNSLDIAKQIITSALNRTQSCGAHFRSDDES
jgi:succinate dehydrogenase / fumarate reductase flavoprotein subunit